MATSRVLSPDGRGRSPGPGELHRSWFVGLALALILWGQPLGHASAGRTCAGVPATIVGTDRSETLRGTPNRDVIVARGGNDTVLGRGGRDLICGGSGEDTLRGGDGGDRLLGGSGFLRGFGGDGNDYITRAARDGGGEFFGGAGDDRLIGRHDQGIDVVDYSTSPDGVDLDLASGTASGHGQDSLVGVEWAIGTQHDDVLMGSDAPNEELYGLAGEDQIDARGGNGDSVHGGLDNDLLNGGAGERDTVLHIYAYNTVDKTGVEVDLTLGHASGVWGNDVLLGFESISGSEYADTLTGTEGPNHIYGQPGDDVVNGLGGDDWLSGGQGTDHVDAGEGYDICIEFELPREGCEEAYD